jgi:hypothetical protein
MLGRLQVEWMGTVADSQPINYCWSWSHQKLVFHCSWKGKFWINNKLVNEWLVVLKFQHSTSIEAWWLKIIMTDLIGSALYGKPKVQISVGLLLEIGTDPRRLSGRFLRFRIMGFFGNNQNQQFVCLFWCFFKQLEPVSLWIWNVLKREPVIL